MDTPSEVRFHEFSDPRVDELRCADLVSPTRIDVGSREMPERVYPWLGLRFQYLRTGELAVRWRDHRTSMWSPLPTGEAAAARWPLPPELAGLAPALVVPDELPPFDDVGVPNVLAVFLDAAGPLRGLPLERLADAMTPSLPPAQLVRWARRPVRPLPPFRLPLRVVGVGRRWRALGTQLREKSWLLSDPAVEEHGFRFEVVEPDVLRARLSRLGPRVDVVITTEDDVRAVLRTRRPPRVAAVFAERALTPAWATTLAVPPGCSLIWLPPPPQAGMHTDAVAENLVYAFIHDLPVHAAVSSISGGFPPHAIAAISDPHANQSLRVRDAVAPALAELARLTAEFDPRDYEGFLQRLDPDELELFEPSRAALREPGESLRSALANVGHLPVDFQHESTGLVPLAQARAAWLRAMSAVPGVRAALDQVVSDPRLVNIVRRRQNRSVDIILQRLEASPLTAFTSEPPPAPAPIERDVVLRAGARYRLTVLVGKASQASLMTERPPSLDPLLPDPPDARGHELEIVVHGHDFEMLTADRRRVYLPLLGSADPVDFDLRAPPADGATEDKPAHARIAVHYRGNLIQSFLLHALVAQEERHRWNEPDTLRVELEFTQSERLANLSDLGPRAFSIGANETVVGSHRLTFVSSDEKAEMLLTDDQIDDAITEFRESLEAATFTGANRKGQRFSLAKPPNWPAFDDYIRRLARNGKALHRLLLVNSADAPPFLEEIGDSHDETIQVVLYRPSFSFPWAGVYDRRIPDGDEAVCLGGATHDELASGAPLEFNCNHGYGSRAFCVFGFWGVRQQLEYRLHGGGDPVNEIPAGQAPEPIHLAVGKLDTYSQGLVDGISEALGPRIRVLASDEDLVELLWGAGRPSQVILVGHLHPRKGDPYIEFAEPAPPLRASDLTDKLERAIWKEQPNSLVLLMACGSAGMRLDSLVTMLQAFTTARAGAVIGTETPVVKSLVARFAADLTTSMWRTNDRLPLAAAMTHARRRLIAAGNPLGFGFSAYGNAELRIQG